MLQRIQQQQSADGLVSLGLQIEWRGIAQSNERGNETKENR